MEHAYDSMIDRFFGEIDEAIKMGPSDSLGALAKTLNAFKRFEEEVNTFRKTRDEMVATHRSIRARILLAEGPEMADLDRAIALVESALSEMPLFVFPPPAMAQDLSDALVILRALKQELDSQADTTPVSLGRLTALCVAHEVVEGAKRGSPLGVLAAQDMLVDEVKRFVESLTWRDQLIPIKQID